MPQTTTDLSDIDRRQMILSFWLRLVIYAVVWGVWLLRKYSGFDLGSLITDSSWKAPPLYYLCVAIVVTAVLEWIALVRRLRRRALQTRGIATAGTITNVQWIPHNQGHSLTGSLAPQSWRITASYVVDGITYTTARRIDGSTAPTIHAAVTVIYDRTKPGRAWLRLNAPPKVP